MAAIPLELCTAFPKHLQVNLLSAHSNVELIRQQIQQFQPKFAYLANAAARQRLCDLQEEHPKTRLIRDEAEFLERLTHPHDITISAIAGVEALRPSLAAVRGCKT